MTDVEGEARVRGDDEVVRRAAALRIEHATEGGQRHGQPVTDPGRILGGPQHLAELFPGHRATAPGGEDAEEVPGLT